MHKIGKAEFSFLLQPTKKKKTKYTASNFGKSNNIRSTDQPIDRLISVFIVHAFPIHDLAKNFGIEKEAL